MSEKFTSEILPSGVRISITIDPNKFYVSFYDEIVPVSKEDIARMYGIAYPEKRNGCCKVDMPKEGPLNSTNKIH